jgi:hypothetical protein
LLELDFRINLEGGFAGQRIVLVEFEIFEARLAHHRPLLLFDCILKELGNERLDNLVSNVVPKVAPHLRAWSVAGAKAVDSCHASILRCHRIDLTPNHVERNLNQEFFLAIRCFHKSSTVDVMVEIRTASLELHSNQR